METDVNTPQPRVNPLLRLIVMPYWLVAVLALAPVYAFIHQLDENPLWLLIVLTGCILVGTVVGVLLRRRTDRTLDTNIEAKTALTGEAPSRPRRRSRRTCPVWCLVILIAVSAGVLLDTVGIISAP